jgi:hypothetical protein
MSDDKQTIEDLKRQIEELKKGKEKGVITFKVSPKKAVSVYGLQRFPVTLYKTQWKALFERFDDLKKFIEEHDSELADGKDATAE